MIGVNFTIIIQMVNFYIAFILLKNLLFKPAIKYLQQEEKREQEISEKISEQQVLIKEKLEEKNKDWQNCQQYFSQNCPKLSINEPVKIAEKKDGIQDEPETEISSKEIDIIAQHIEKALLERIKND